MDIDQEMKATQEKLKDVVNQINNLERQKSQLTQEALRLDGELRVLKRLNENKEKPQ